MSYGMIYEPKGQALEYAELACNPYSGCGHKCAYCYVPKSLKMRSRELFDIAATERKAFLTKLTKDCRHFVTDQRQVLFSFSTDPYHPFDTTLTRQSMQTIQEATALGICTLTKGGTRALRDLDLFRPNRDCFATTLTSLDDAFSKKWESGAAVASDRIQALRAFYDAGIYTWASLEPTIDVEASLAIIRETHGFINLFKIGRINYSPITKQIDWQDYALRIIELCQQLGVNHYIKKDLQKYLPENYPNPLRIQQHH